jgi:hypothetical protein
LAVGRFDEFEDQVIIYDAAITGDIDLLNGAALTTLGQGGSVSLVASGTLPNASPAAAVLRY